MTRTILSSIAIIAALAVTAPSPAAGNQASDAGFELAGSRIVLAKSSVHANRSIANPAGPAEKKKKKLTLPCVKKADGSVICPPPSPQ